MKGNKLAIFDLDGTLIKSNTFHLLLKYSILKGLIQFRFGLIIKILFYTAQRVAKRYSREVYKQKIYHLTKDLVETDQFRDYCLKQLNTQVYEHLSKLQNSHTIIIASAAMPYAIAIAKKLGASKIYTSIEVDQDWIENSSEVKLSRLKKDYPDTEGYEYFFTDHAEDLPLARLCQNLFIVRPTPNSHRAFQEANLSFELIK